MQIQFAGSLYSSLRSAASAWAETALPDVSVIGAGEDASTAASGLEDYWWTEAAKAGLGAPEGVDADDWHDACRDALTWRIARVRRSRAR